MLCHQFTVRRPWGRGTRSSGWTPPQYVSRCPLEHRRLQNIEEGDEDLPEPRRGLCPQVSGVEIKYTVEGFAIFKRLSPESLCVPLVRAIGVLPKFAYNPIRLRGLILEN